MIFKAEVFFEGIHRLSLWRKKALELLPVLRKTITASPNVMRLWIELQFELDQAYSKGVLDGELVTNIYRYAHWSVYEAGNIDAVTAVCVAFFEHLPRNSKVWKDLPNRLSTDDFMDLKELFRGSVRPEECETFERDFFAAKEHALHLAPSPKKVINKRRR